MPKAYSGDLRERVIEAVETGASRREAAERFEVSVSSAVKWLQRWRERKSAAPKPRGGSISPLEEFATEILALVAERPDLTLVETVAALRKRRIKTSRSSEWQKRIVNHGGLGVRDRRREVGLSNRRAPVGRNEDTVTVRALVRALIGVRRSLVSGPEPRGIYESRSAATEDSKCVPAVPNCLRRLHCKSSGRVPLCRLETVIAPALPMLLSTPPQSV